MTDFVQFARGHGLVLDHAVRDGRWRRTVTEDHPRKKNGAYVLDDRGGVVRNWATMLDFAVWRPEHADRIDRTQFRQARRDADAQREGMHRRAVERAHSMIKAAALVVPRGTERRQGGLVAAVCAHPYLVSKGLGGEQALVVGGLLLLPMYDLHGALVGAQTIDAAGKKLFIPGTKAKGAVHRLGRGTESWLVEGYATGLTVRAALARMYRCGEVVVCFSAENLKHVAAQCGTFVVADNDASGTGERAAVATGLPWCMPPTVGQDANDLQQAAGLVAVMQMMRGVLSKNE